MHWVEGQKEGRELLVISSFLFISKLKYPEEVGVAAREYLTSTSGLK